MHKYEHVEDYLEVIAGLRDSTTLKPAGFGWFSPIINLARYDIPVLDSMSEHTFNGGSLTERQGELAKQLIAKYRRQLASLGIDSSTNEQIKFRRPFRVLDDSKDIYISEGNIKIKFPYNKALIEEIKLFSEQSQGRCQWDRDERVWKSSLTEYNLSWLMAWGGKNNFSFDTETKSLFDDIKHVESLAFSISLSVVDGQVVLTNAEESLLSYIKENLGGLTFENLVSLIDHSSQLGYQVDPTVFGYLDTDISKDLRQLLMERQIIEPKKNIALIKSYASLTDRFPIVIYEPDLTNELLRAAKEHFGEHEIQVIGSRPTKHIDIDSSCRVIHTIKPLTKIDIPLLISQAGLIAGGERQMMLQRSQKVVYSAPAVYNNKKRTTVNHIQ